MRDVMGFVGLVLLAVGVWMVSPAAALIVVGAVMLGLAVFAPSQTKKDKGQA